MRASIKSSNIGGIIHAPASKSSMQRALAASLVRRGRSVISNPGQSKDDLSSLQLIMDLGASVTTLNDELFIESNGVHALTNVINCGESGLGLRMFAPLISLDNHKVTINGEGTLLNRPMHFFDEVFPQLGVEITSNKGMLPITINGPLKPANISIDGSLSSQFLTGLLFAYSASGAKNVSINVKDLTSRPYIDLTLDVMKKFGLPVPINENYESFHFNGSTVDISDEIHYTVEGDWSGGSFLLVAAAIAGNVTVTGLDMMSTQADKAIIEVLMSANASLAIEAKGIKMHSSKLSAFTFDATECPDLFPPLVALAAYCKGSSVITGVNRLKYKESDRAKTLKDEFSKMGIKIEINNNEMVVTGGDHLLSGTFDSHGDHRIAMACAIAALRADGTSVIENAKAVNKSYPDFFWHLKKLGADVTLNKMITT